MKPLAALALLLALSVSAVAAEKKDGISISFDSDDQRAQLAPRYAVRDARLAVTTRGGAATLLLTNEKVAVQLSESLLARMKAKEDGGLLEEMIVAGVRTAMSKAVEYPLANIRSAEISNGALVLTNDEGKPVFEDIKVNGEVVTKDLSTTDAAKFVAAFRALKKR